MLKHVIWWYKLTKTYLNHESFTYHKHVYWRQKNCYNDHYPFLCLSFAGLDPYCTRKSSYFFLYVGHTNQNCKKVVRTLFCRICREKYVKNTTGKAHLFMNKQLLSVYNVTELCNLGKYLCLHLIGERKCFQDEKYSSYPPYSWNLYKCIHVTSSELVLWIFLGGNYNKYILYVTQYKCIYVCFSQ